MKEDITKLPQWAQSELRRLRDNLAAAENRFAAAFGTTETRIEVDPYRQLDHDRARLFLPDNSTLRFNLAAGYIDVRVERDQVILLGQASSQGDFVVWPRVANSMSVGFCERE